MTTIWVYKTSLTYGAVAYEKDVGDIISSETIDLKNPPALTPDLKRIFEALVYRETPARLVVCREKMTEESHVNNNGWSMCQGPVPMRRRLQDTKTTTYLAMMPR